MTNWQEADLMAYVDGELEGARRDALERALADDPALRERLNAWQAQRDRVAAAFRPVLDEPIPDRLAHLLSQPSDVAVVDLAAARAARRPAHAMRPTARTWRRWGGLAASLVLGLALGWTMSRTEVSTQTSDTAVAWLDGRLVAAGPLAQALSSQLASEPHNKAAVAVQLSFVDRGGAYCRTFSTAALAGLACRQADDWVVQQAAAVTAASPAGDTMHQAATALPPEVLDTVDRRMAGPVLDAAGERRARDAGWRR